MQQLQSGTKRHIDVHHHSAKDGDSRQLRLHPMH